MGTWDCAGRGMLWQVQELGAGACGTCEATQIVGERCLAGRLLLMAVQAVFTGGWHNLHHALDRHPWASASRPALLVAGLSSI